jgi:hypothetical protein
MSHSAVAATPTPPPSDSAPRRAEHLSGLRAFKWPLLAGGAAVASLFAVAVGIAPQNGASTLEHNLATLSDTWAVAQPAALQRVAFQPAKQAALGHQTVGDEGFWLSRQDLSSQTTGFVAVGDRISLASKAGDPATEKVSVFEVTELKPLSGAAALAPAMTVVICREQTSDAATPPRTVRFLMETTLTGPAASPAAPRNL